MMNLVIQKRKAIDIIANIDSLKRGRFFNGNWSSKDSCKSALPFCTTCAVGAIIKETLGQHPIIQKMEMGDLDRLIGENVDNCLYISVGEFLYGDLYNPEDYLGNVSMLYEELSYRNMDLDDIKLELINLIEATWPDGVLFNIGENI